MGCGESPRTVDPGLRKYDAELAHEDTQRLLPGRGRIGLPQRLGELISRHRPSVLEREVREEEATLAREVSLVQDDSIRFQGDPTREEDLQLSLQTVLAEILPGR